MGSEDKESEGHGIAIAKLDALSVGLAVLQAVLNVRSGVEDEIEISDHGVTIRVCSHPASTRVIVLEV